MIALLGTAFTFPRFRHPTSQSAIHSLAVLPLSDEASLSGQEYLAGGLTDELTADLGRLGNLRVVARDSARRYAGSQKPLSQIAKELKVEALITGAVERRDDELRVRARLVRGDTGEVLWSHTYERSPGDLLSLDRELSQDVSQALRLTLTPEVQRRAERAATSNPQAREAYFRANYFFDKDDKEGASVCFRWS